MTKRKGKYNILLKQNPEILVWKFQFGNSDSEAKGFFPKIPWFGISGACFMKFDKVCIIIFCIV